MNLKHTALYDEHKKLGAKLLPFAGFEMPIQYNSVKEEILAVRNKCGVFDVSHMGEFFVEGPDAVHFVDHLLTNDFEKSAIEKAVYSPLCNEEGKILDDLIAYKLGPHKVLICVNAANIDKDWNWISSKTPPFDCKLTNRSENYSLLAVQGPETEKVLLDLGISHASNMNYYSAKECTYKESEIILARTGYTGEDGFEIFASHEAISNLWEQLIKRGVTPCGLASRDVLRLEACYPLYGHELSEDITPLDAALKWTVKADGERDFIGKEALKSYNPKHRLIKLSLDKGIPRDGHIILNDNEEKIGVVTSGTMSVSLKKGIALALIEKNLFPENKTFFISIRNKIYPATFHTKAFISGGHK